MGTKGPERRHILAFVPFCQSVGRGIWCRLGCGFVISHSSDARLVKGDREQPRSTPQVPKLGLAHSLPSWGLTSWVTKGDLSQGFDNEI